MTTMIFDLPEELIEMILCKIPLKSVRIVRLACKKWNTFYKSRSFSKLHLANLEAASEGESRRIVIMGNDLYSMSIFLDGDQSTNPKFKLDRLNEQVKISQVFHCDGLLLCIFKNDNTKLVVWNPYLDQTRLIKPKSSYPSKNHWYMDKCLYGIGYVTKQNKSCRSYKILRFLNYQSRVSRSHFKWYEIYDFDSDSWSNFHVPTQWFMSFNQRGVSLNGNTYFCATVRNLEYELNDHLICFDFTGESFGPLLRFPFSAGISDYVTLSCVREEKLAVSYTNPHGLEVWITTEIASEKVSWSRFLRLDNFVIPPRGFFIDEEKKVVMGLDVSSSIRQCKLSIIGEDGYIRRLDLGETSNKKYWCTLLCSYVPSLVEVKLPAAGGKRKKQSNLQEQNVLKRAR